MAEEGSALDLEGFEKRLQSLFTNGCSSHALQVDGKTVCSEFRKLVEDYTCHWQTPLPQLRILEIALCYFDRESYLFPVGCDEVHYMLSSLALSVFELLLFFDKNDFDQDPLKHFTVTFQECHMSLARHQNVHLLEVINCLQDGGPWGNVTLQSILTQSTLPQTQVDRYISTQVPVFLELRVRYLLTCERVSEAMALAKCCSQHPTAGEHPFFLQVYLTWLHKTSQNDLLNKELANLNGKDALHIICNMESEEEDESLLALTRAFLSQELRRGDMDHLCDLVFIWSKLHMRLKTSKQVLLEESHELMLSATNVNSIFPFIRVILEELGNDGLQFCVELCTKALQSCDDVGTKSLIYKTIAGLFPNDLEMCRACALLVYFLEPMVEAYKMVFQLYTQPDQEYNADASPVSNQVRFELLQVLKKGLHFDPEFCDLMALRANCKNLMSETAENAALEEILDNCIKEPDLHLSIHTSYFQQRTDVAQQAGAKQRQTKDDKKNHMTTERGTASTDVAAASASSVDHAVMTKEKRAVNETPALDSLWQSFWQLDKMFHSLIPPRFSEKKRPRRKIRKPGWLMEYSETAEDLEKASTSSETPEDLDEASTSLPSGKPLLMENSETHEDLDKASTSLLTKMKPAVVVLSRLPRINKASTLLLITMKSAVVVLPKLPQLHEASSSLLVNEAVLPKLPQLHEASSSLLVNEAVLPKLPQLHEASSSLLVNEAGSGGPSQTPPAVVVLPEHSSQAAPLPLVPLQQCISEEEGEGVSVGSEGEDTVPVGSDTCWDPKWDQDSEPECNQSETLMPQANSTGLMSPAPELTRTGQGRDSSPHPGVTSQTSQTLVFSCPECLFAFTSKAFLHRHMKRCPKDIYCQWNGQIPSAACQQITSTACSDLVPVVTLGDESPPSTPVPGDPPCITSATDPKRGDTDQQIPYSHQRFIKTLFIKTLTQPGEVKMRHLIHTGKKTHNCEWCDMSFNKLDSLRNHQTLHTGVKPFQCEECGECFSNKRFLKQHQCFHTGVKPWQCDVCDKSLICLRDLKVHKHVHTDVQPFHCELCNTGCIHFHLKEHQLIHTDEKPFPCKVCDMSFSQKRNLKQHLRTHTGEKPYDCKDCGKNLCTHTSQHMKLHTAEKPFHCKVCGMNFRWKVHLRNHILIHRETYDCKDCGMNFDRKGHLKRHLRTHTGEKPYDSNVCGENLCQKDNLKNHLSTHTGEKTYDSKDCGKFYSQANNLNQHMQVHTGEKPLRCKVCGENFSQKGHLNRHLRTHTGEKPYNCKDCGKNFAWKESLKRHIRNFHTGEKPFDSNVCGENVCQKDNLKQHLPTHTGEKTYDCEDCGMKFAWKESLKRHIRIIHTSEKQHLRTHTGEKHLRTHTGEKPYDCKDCGKKFLLKNSLRRHIRIIHTGEKQHLRIHTGERPYDCGKRFNDGHHLNNHECFHLFDDPNPGVHNYGHGITVKHSQTMADQQAHGTWEHDILVDKIWVGEISTDYTHDDALLTGELNGHATGDALVHDIIEIRDHDYV